jgi:lipopolysaccharide export system protein LptA
MRWSRWIWLAAVVVLGGASGAETEPGDSTRLALGVAPFEVDAPPAAAVPDVAKLLAARLGTRGVQRVVGPAQLGAVPDADAEPAVVQGWASEAELDAVVVGRTTRIGDQLSVDVRLRAGDTGEVARTLIEQFPSSEDLEGGVDHLAGEVIAAMALLLKAPEPAVSAPGPVASVGESLAAAGDDRAEARGGGWAASEGNGRAPFGFDFGGGDEPLAIESEELEVLQKDGWRRLVFKKNVRVRQGKMQLSSALLEAIYPEGGSQPDRLVAKGNVRLAQGDQKARCDRLDYNRLRERLVCRGNAWFEDGENRLSGEIIEVDLRDEKVTVKGGATVLIQPEKKVEGGRTS